MKRIHTFIIGLVGVIVPEVALADITLLQSTQAILNYEAYTRAQENAAAAQDLYTPAPQIQQTMQAPLNIQATWTQAGTYLQAELGNIVPWLLLTSYGNTSYAPPVQISGGISGAPPLVQSHFSLFCSAQEVQFYPSYCSPGSSAPLGDMNPLSLFGTNHIAANNQTAVITAREFIKKLTSPSYDGILAGDSTQPLSQYDPGSIADLNRRMNEAAQNGLAAYSLYNMLTKRMPQSQQQDRSLLEMMEQEATRRFMDPTWAEGIASTPQAGLLRELAHMEAFRLYMDFVRYEQMERIEALLATMVSQNANLVRKPTDDKQLAASRKAISYHPPSSAPTLTPTTGQFGGE